MLRAVLLDVGGTLWPDRLAVHLPDDVCLAQLQRLLPSVEPVQSLAALRAALSEDDSPLVQSTHAVLGRAIQRLGAECTGTDVVAVRRALCAPASPAISPFPHARDLLEAVRDLGLRCVVLSNVQVRGAAEYWRDFADLGLADLIDGVVTSLEVGYRKPHAAMFEAALREAGCPASACVMVGDSEVKDIQPAVGIGMRAIRVAIEQPPPTRTAAQAVATNLVEVRAMIAAWAARPMT